MRINRTRRRSVSRRLGTSRHSNNNRRNNFRGNSFRTRAYDDTGELRRHDWDEEEPLNWNHFNEESYNDDYRANFGEPTSYEYDLAGDYGTLSDYDDDYTRKRGSRDSYSRDSVTRPLRSRFENYYSSDGQYTGEMPRDFFRSLRKFSSRESFYDEEGTDYLHNMNEDFKYREPRRSVRGNERNALRPRKYSRISRR